MIHPIIWYMESLASADAPGLMATAVRALSGAAESSESLATESALSVLDIAARNLLDELAFGAVTGEAERLAEYIARYRGERA